MKISVVMSTYNEELSWLKKSIDSIIHQTFKDFEFIIVLDNPKNNEIKRLVESYSKIDQRIVIIYNEYNMGLVRSLNRAISVANGEYIARMDADDIALSHRFQTQIDFIESNNLDLVGSNIELFNDKGVFFRSDKLIRHHFIESLFRLGTIGIVHPTFFGRKSMFDALGGYANASHTEDKEFLARVFVNGFTVGNCSEVLLMYRHQDKSITKSNAYIVHVNGVYITSQYNKYIKTGEYVFDPEYINIASTDELVRDSYNKKQMLLGEVRSCFGRKNYIKGLFLLCRCVFLSNTTFLNVKINLGMRLLRFREKLSSFRLRS